uniref:Non-structural polyprotein 1AB n=1 Tax=Wenling rattails astrovirus 3 TaxID=2116137 RepID=A0A2P1GND2_9VIRU|nr:ORF1b [Wenling rattails astrovirus 3]
MTLPVKATKNVPKAGISAVLGLVDDTIYGPSHWTTEAYKNIFEKFNYADANDTPLTEAQEVLYHEYDYMVGRGITSFIDVDKNTDSHPGYPGRYLYEKETDLIADLGLEEYHHFKSCFECSASNPLWYGFLKSETMKKEKIEREDIRLIACAPAQYTRLGATYEMSSNNALKRRTKKKQAQIGWRPVEGGFDAAMKRFDACEWMMEMDWTRYDGTLPAKVWDAVNQFRVNALAASPREKALYEKYRRSLSDRATVLATGDIVKMTKGNPSGQYSTSVDNCMCQTLLTFYETRDWIEHVTGETPTVQQVFDSHVTISYGDDRLTGWTKTGDFAHIFPPDREWLVKYYKDMFGMWVKPENIRIQRERIGLSFCGMTVSRGHKGYVPIFRGAKLLSALVTPSGDVNTLEDLEDKVVSLAHLSAWDDSPAAREIRRGLTILTKIDPSFVAPEREAMRMFWEDQRS